MEGGRDAAGSSTSTVVANRIVFGRVIGGAPVLGGGSTIHLTFANDGTPLDFTYDWPSYEAKQRPQHIAPVGDILHRVQKIVLVRTGSKIDAVTAPPMIPPSTAPSKSAYPFDLSENTQLEKFECGYIDLKSGVVQSSNVSSVQPGCLYQVIETRRSAGGNVHHGLAGAVPAGVSFETDAQWPETGVLTGQQTSGALSAPDARSHR